MSAICPWVVSSLQLLTRCRQDPNLLQENPQERCLKKGNILFLWLANTCTMSRREVGVRGLREWGSQGVYRQDVACMCISVCKRLSGPRTAHVKLLKGSTLILSKHILALHTVQGTVYGLACINNVVFVKINK